MYFFKGAIKCNCVLKLSPEIRALIAKPAEVTASKKHGADTFLEDQKYR